MVRKMTTWLVFLCLFAGFPDSAKAQKVSPGISTVRFIPGESVQRSNDLKKQYPMFEMGRALGNPNAGFVHAPVKGKAVAPAHPITISSQRGKQMFAQTNGTEFWVNITYAPGMTKATDRSISSFNSSAPSDLNTLMNGNFTFYNGVGMVDGKIYAGHNVKVEGEGYSPMLYTIDTETWTLAGADYLQDFSLMAFETATAADGTIYGEFFSANGATKEIGVVDYLQKSRTTLMETAKFYVAMGITRENVLYGIASDGNLYRIDPEKRTETKVGSTGVNLSDESGLFYYQTGEIDTKDNTFYWLGTDQSKKSTSLYTVDLQTGKATALYEFGEYTFSGMIIKQPEAEEGAPAMAENLSLMFDGEATDGLVSFTTPSVTFGGQPLQGNLTYQVVVDGKEVSTGNTAPGKSESVGVSVDEGQHVFEVTVSNRIGTSPKAKLSQWIGYDIPEQPTNVVMEVDKESGSAFVYWEAPVRGLHDGYFGGIYYDIYRIVNGHKELVEENFGDTYFEETLAISDISTYSYGIVARNGSQKSEMAYSNTEKLGHAFSPPYIEDFENEGKFMTWTTIDVAGDKQESSFGSRAAWIYDAKEQAAAYTFGEKMADDWLISPPVKMLAGKTYTVSLRAKARAGTSKVYPERIEVKMGKGTTVSDMTMEIVPETDLDNATYKMLANTQVAVAADGDYNIGVHAISTRDGWTLYVDSVMVDQNASPSSPSAVIDLVATADPNGELKASIRFKTPAKTVAGDALDGQAMNIELRRDNKVIHVFENAESGKEMQYQDTDVRLGYHTYALIPYIGEEQGEKNETKVYVGVDVPDHVRNIQAFDQTTSVKLTWNKVGNVGANGGLVIPENVDYIIWNTASYNGNLLLYQKIDSIRNGSEVNIPFNTDEGEQGDMYWAVQTKNIAGEGDAYLGSLLVGKPYELPMKETLPNGLLTYFWSFNGLGTGVLMQPSANSSDGDGYGFDISSSEDGGYGELYSGKISLAGAAHPTLTVDLKTTSKDNSIGVYIVKPDGTEVMAGVISPEKEYSTYKIDLSAYSTERYIRVAFFESFDVAGSFAFDNINVVDMKENDLMVNSLQVPPAVKAGEKANMKLVVKNFGLNKVDAYTVRITAGDQELLNQNVTEALEPMKERTFEVSMATTLFDEAGDRTVRAEIIYGTDDNRTNNAAQSTISVLASQAAKPENLTVAQKGDGVEMNWEAPRKATKLLTEDFENVEVFEPFSLGGITASMHEGAFGEWSLIDGDGQQVSMWGAVSYPNAAKPHAWQVINPETLFGDKLYEKDRAYSGHQYIISLCPFTGAADDWLISPELPGIAQTVTFYVKCLSLMYGDETYEVLYSTTDNRRESFVKLDDPELPTTDWKQQVVNLPAGTKYFAIRHTAANAFGLLVDDISYAVEGGNVEKYNIYLDRELIATVENGATTYWVTAKLSDGEHLFSVTAINDENVESAPISVSLVVTGIEEILNSGLPFDVYSIDGKLVRTNARNLKGLRGVYVINGKKVMVR
ncbi:MAG: choice-of-anchor J domain-containing protein [Prevotella sp.]|nr:choice-of-anchor J domain-containing protein [Prevotella sp.]